jgi:hypothetical protein
MKPVHRSRSAAASVARRSSASARAGANAGTVVELFQTLVAGGRWWMVPMVAVLGLAALILAAVTAIEYVAPFVYTIF